MKLGYPNNNSYYEFTINQALTKRTTLIHNLIFHDPNNKGGISPFDTALLQVSTKAKPLYLASPYIGLSSLCRILETADDWKLLSDVEAWLSSGNQKHRARCWKFIVNNLGRIRHVPGLHAKVAIGNNLLFFGSANFTEKGILSRDEFSMLTDDIENIKQSLYWFNALWDTASPPVIQEGDELVKSLDSFRWTTPNSRVRLSSSTLSVKSVLDTSNRPTGFDVAKFYAELSISESDKQLSINSAYQQISDVWFSTSKTFTFKELCEAVSSLQPTATTGEIWLLVIKETTNHWLGGLIDDGFDLYVYADNHFTTWSASQLRTTKNLDYCAEFVIDNLPMYPAHSLLMSDEDWLKHNVPAHQIFLIIEQLIKSGLVIENDAPGEVATYSIEPNFQWPKRWKKFTEAKKSYLEKQKLTVAAVDELDDSGGYTDESTSDYVANINAIKDLSKNPHNLDFFQLKIELKSSAKALGVSESELIKMREMELFGLFSTLLPNLLKLGTKEIIYRAKALPENLLPAGLIINFQDKNKGPFNHAGKLSRDWVASYYLNLYPKTLETWKSLLYSNNL